MVSVTSMLASRLTRICASNPSMEYERCALSDVAESARNRRTSGTFGTARSEGSSKPKNSRGLSRIIPATMPDGNCAIAVSKSRPTASRNDCLECAFFVAGVALHDRDHIRNEIVTAFELHVDIRPRVVAQLTKARQAIEREDGPPDDEQSDDSGERHAPTLARQRSECEDGMWESPRVLACPERRVPSASPPRGPRRAPRSRQRRTGRRWEADGVPRRSAGNCPLRAWGRWSCRSSRIRRARGRRPWCWRRDCAAPGCCPTRRSRSSCRPRASVRGQGARPGTRLLCPAARRRDNRPPKYGPAAL